MTPRRAGFRKIDNDTFEALIAAGLSGAGYQVVLTVIDRTMGFRKGSGYKEKASIPLTYFKQVTGLSRQSVRKAVKQAENRRIIIVERDSTRPSIYALNKDTSTWLTGKQNHPSELGNKITPDWETKSPYTRKLAMPSCMPAKETSKETLKGRGYDKEKGYASNRVTTSVGEDHLPQSGSIVSPLISPPTLIRNKIRNVNNEPRSTMEKPFYSHQEPIASYLDAHGPAAIKTIAQATGIKANSVNLTLHKGKGKLFHHLKDQRVWDVKRDGGES